MGMFLYLFNSCLRRDGNPKTMTSLFGVQPVFETASKHYILLYDMHFSQKHELQYILTLCSIWRNPYRLRRIRLYFFFYLFVCYNRNKFEQA